MVINSGPMEWICDMLSHTSHYLVHAQYLINNSWGRIPDCVPAVSAMTIVTGKMSWRCWCGILYECLRHAPPSTQSSDIMIIQVLHCPHCHGTDIVRHGAPVKTSNVTVAESAKRNTGAPFYWTMPIQAKPWDQRSDHRDGDECKWHSL